MNSDKLKTLFPADEICTDLKKNQTNQKQTPKQNKKETQTKQTRTPPPPPTTKKTPNAPKQTNKKRQESIKEKYRKEQ